MSDDDTTPVDPCPACGWKVTVRDVRCPGCGVALTPPDSPPLPTGRAVGEEPDAVLYRQGEDTTVDPIKALDDTGTLPRKEVEFMDLATVYSGSWSEVLAAKASLGARGFETYIQDEATKIIDPFLTGGSALIYTLKAPADTAREIHRLLEADRARLAEPEVPVTAEDRARIKTEALGRRIILSAIFFFTGPAGVVLGLYYIQNLMVVKQRPSDWGWVVFWFLVCALETLGMVWVLADIFVR